MKPFATRNRARRAFTLVEAVVALVAGTIAVVGAWAFFRTSLLHLRSTDSRLEGVQGLQILTEALEHDLRRVYYALPDHPVTIERDRAGNGSLEFFVYDGEATDARRTDIRVTLVRYDFVAATGRITRRDAHGVTTFGHVYERVVFGQFPHDGAAELQPLPYLELPPYAETGDAGALPRSDRNLVAYQITCVPATIFSREASRRRPQDRTTVWGGVLLDRKASSTKHHFWLPNLTSLPRARGRDGGAWWAD